MTAKQDPMKFMDKKFRDEITGFEGMCTGVTFFTNGCIQLQIEPPISDEGEFREGRWLDEQRCKAVTGRTPALQAQAGGGRAGTRR